MAKLSSVSARAPKSLDKEQTKKKTAKLVAEIGELQQVLFAQGKYSLLVVLQGLDASGKDGAIKNVFSSVNLLGCSVKSFKAPTKEELAHDFLWRVHKESPEKGFIRIFNRSHYEDVLVPVVENWIDEKTTQLRYKHINQFEELLTDHDTLVLKFYLHVSPKEQQERLLERKTNPEKFWKHNDNDLITAKKYNQYMQAYEKLIQACNKPAWIIVPADQNWYKEFLLAETIVKALRKLKLEYPKPVPAK
jgi:PPK2 family polyphosphate:nucleotide phosphotransferase